MATFAFASAQQRVCQALIDLKLIPPAPGTVPAPDVPSQHEPDPAADNDEDVAAREAPAFLTSSSDYWVAPIRYQTLAERVLLERQVLNTVLAKHAPEGTPPVSHSKSVDGLYESRFPHVLPDNVAILKGRLTREGRNADVDVMEPDPIRPGILRPLTDKSTLNPNLATIVMRPGLCVSADSIVYRCARIDVQSGRLRSHPLFTVEDALAAELEDLYGEWQRRRHVDFDSYYRDRLRAMRDVARHLQERIVGAGDVAQVHALRTDMASLLSQICQAAQARDVEAAEDRRLFTRMYQCWADMKQWRETHHDRLCRPGYAGTYAGTRVRLQVRELQTADNDERTWKRDEDEQVEEVLSLERVQQQLKSGGVVEPIDEDAIRVRVHRRMLQARRAPGTPAYEPILDHGAAMTEDEDCSAWERRRRALIRHQRIAADIVLNDRIVCTTAAVDVQFPSWAVHWDTTTEVLVLSHPQSCRIVLRACRSPLLPYTTLGSVDVAVPDRGAAPVVAEYSWASAPNAFPAHHDDAAVAGLWPSDPITTVRGDVTVVFAWHDHDDTSADAGEDHYDSRDAAPSPTMSRVLSSMVLSALDLNDPRNDDVIALTRRLGGIGARRPTQFVSHEIHPSLRLLAPEYALRSGRHVVLRDRSRGRVPDQAVALDDNAIPDYMFDGADDGVASDDDGEVDVGSVVNEQVLPVIDANRLMFERLLAPRRDLRPRREPRPPTGAPVDTAHLVVQVVRGQNFPVRRLGAETRRPPAPSSPDEDTETDHLQRLASQVQITFQGHRRLTEVRLGAYPVWNETVQLPVRCEGAGPLTPSALLAIGDTPMQIDVFDVVIVEDGGTGPALTTTRTTRVERRWVGGATIPIRTVYLDRQVEGAVHVHVPITSLEYERVVPPRPTLLHVFATMDPMIATIGVPRRPTCADERLQSAHDRWRARVRSAMPAGVTRPMPNAIVCDVAGRQTTVTAFLGPIAGPPGVPDDDMPWFVSAIPMLGTVDARRDVHMSCAEVVELMAGDEREHAMVLACSLMHSERQGASPWRTYLCVARTLTGARTFVLRNRMQHGRVKETDLVDACTAVRWPATDESGPVVDVVVVYNDQQVWANVQAQGAPHRMSFQLDNIWAWVPLWERTAKKATSSAYLTGPTYFTAVDQYYLDRAACIERILETHLVKSRAATTTVIDHGCSQVLREALQAMEFVRQGRTQAGSDAKDIDRIRPLFAAMYGAPIWFPDGGADDLIDKTEGNPVVQAVLRTRIHENEHPGVRYARAAYIYPYPNLGGALWVFVAAMVPH
ncbi:CC2D2A N-terminal C2 domain containing protein [Plasmodiophora brassicae]